jgi:hypothetical protein
MRRSGRDEIDAGPTNWTAIRRIFYRPYTVVGVLGAFPRRIAGISVSGCRFEGA